MLELYGKPTSINVRKVLWLCDELALEYTLHPYGSGFASVQTPAFRALNPNALVPVLCDGALVLWESNTICRYLAARSQRHDLLPAAPAARAVVEQWMDWQATELNTAWRYAFMASVRGSAAHTGPRAIADSVAQWNRHMAILDAQLQRGGPTSWVQTSPWPILCWACRGNVGSPARSRMRHCLRCRCITHA
ncbi:glutathione S-transferase N-terminal domain-containing protein [Xanthomonas nasturtii]|nr:glutathione S-transferase N-terminal domain-containing protein [Xanthomonas nasturtii]MCL1500604.1 glutathione S-transferase N-terminal domain-containing protein [Xanthomonas nasturtii]MCL1505283.1 glutathione S-transferase N-terminal domain-containing protein [Xanthomonas nasturtii]MCL1524201.1 glutathione S-transferase N-terminal domain-containing protein [Xanthomonas nasturtii]MCL1526412.1 glutathione S-transferase N-terminal domain-containing protein [Xanthomonas nasturtii]MCL1533937.1 